MASVGGRVVAVQTSDAQLGGAYPWSPTTFSTPLAWDEVDGFISVIDAAADSYLERLRSQGKPVVSISHRVQGFDCPEVVPDNRSGVMAAVSHLVRHGHSQIAFAGKMDQPDGDDVYERYEAYCEALRDHGLRPDPGLVLHAPSSLGVGGEIAGRCLLASRAPCTAVVAATDLIAAGLVRTLKAAGLALPSQMAVIGFDDRDFAAGLSPALASVRVDFAELGAEAARLVVDMSRGVEVPLSRHRVATRFVPRESCGCFGSSLPGRSSGPAGEARESLATNLGRVLNWDSSEEGALAVRRTADGIAGCCEEALAGCGADVERSKAVAEEAYRAFPRTATTAGVIECMERYRRDLLCEVGYSPERLAALDHCTFQVAQALNSADTRQFVQVNAGLQDSLAEEHYVSLALVGIGPKASKPRSLAWLEGTHAKNACLGLWEAAPEEGDGASKQLRVAGVFGAGMSDRLAAGTTLDVASFPPIGALTSEGCGPEDIVLAIPVRTKAHYWGILALAGEVEAAASAGGDVYFQWTALLGMTLDKEALLEEVRASEQRYALAANAANDGLWDWDVTNATVYYSPRWKAMLGYAEGEIGTAPAEWFSRVYPDDLDTLEPLVAACLRGETGSLQLEHRVRAKDGTYRWALCRAVTVKAGGERAVRMVGSLTDISERKDLENKLRHAALYDSLTGLANRSLLVDRMDQAFARARRTTGYQFALLFIDLDGFKTVNDTLGHAFGDLLLTKVADRLKTCLRTNDTAVRYGGDEFAVLLDGVSGDKRAHAIAQRLRSRLSLPYEIEGNKLTVSATIGTAISTTGYKSPDEMIHDADLAMYQSKPGDRPVARPIGAVELPTDDVIVASLSS
jgi:diguanylate cyclase (GGDEF)-like protein/PAS domain S-box-containing protein